MQNNTQQNVQKSTTSSTQKKAPPQRFALTPQSVGMDSAILQPRNQQEQTAQTQKVPSSISQPSVTFKPCSKEQVQQLQNSFQDMTTPSKNSNSKSVTELRSSSMSSNASVYKPLCFERRSSSPSSPNLPVSHGSEAFMPPLNSTAQNAYRSFCAQVSQKISPPSTPTNEDDECGHPTCDATHECLPPSQEIPIQHFEQQLEKFRSGSNFFSGGAAEINGQLNEIFINRLKDIDANGQGDTNLKLVTYQEWVEMLLKINESILSNVEELEIEVAKRLEYAQQRVSLNCRHSQGNELMQCRKDIDTLIKIVQSGLHSNEWDFHGMTFETVTPVQVFGVSNAEFEKRHSDAQNSTSGNSLEGADSMQRNKLLGNMKALALEVAEKHDEVRDLKRQVGCLEDDIQKAQKKIQFKDDVIKELRNDLKRNAKVMLAKYHINSSPSVDDSSIAMPPINFENETGRAQKATELPAPSELTLSQQEHLEQQKITQLSDDLDEYLNYNRNLSEHQRKHLMAVVKKAESEKANAYRKLDFIRHQLTDLENSQSKPIDIAAQDNGSGISSKNEFDQDWKILDGVRKRMRSQNDTICGLRLKLEKSEREKTELTTKLKASETITKRNDETLRGVAELLCDITGQPFSYTDIYKTPKPQRVNPFCETIKAMTSVYMQREQQLTQSLAQKNQKIEELIERLSHAETIVNEQQKQRSNLSEGEDIDKITPPSSLLLQSQQATLLSSQSTVQQTTSLLMTRQSKENSLSDEHTHRQ